MKQQLYVYQYPKVKKYAEGMVIDAQYDRGGIERCPKCNGAVSGLKWVGDKKVAITSKPLPDFLINSESAFSKSISIFYPFMRRVGSYCVSQRCLFVVLIVFVPGRILLPGW